MTVEKKGSNNKKIEFHIPIDISSEVQCFGIVGFVHDGDILFIDISYLSGDRKQGMILRTTVGDGYSYQVVNRVVAVDEHYNPTYLNKPAEYDESLYDPKDVKLWKKVFNLEQISIFSELVEQLIADHGVENITQEAIFNNVNVRKILGLDLPNPYDFELI